jgi:hypothetical protein
MRVVHAQNGDKVEANCVYVIPPGNFLASVDGHLSLTKLEPERGKRMQVDLFFRTLADTHGPHSAAIVLSGADSDGAIGIKRIKERGGLTIAQDPDEAEHNSMPRSAINTGMVDWVLQVEQMPAQLLKYRANEARLSCRRKMACSQASRPPPLRVKMRRRCGTSSPSCARAPDAIFRITSGPQLSTVCPGNREFQRPGGSSTAGGGLPRSETPTSLRIRSPRLAEKSAATRKHRGRGAHIFE